VGGVVGVKLPSVGAVDGAADGEAEGAATGAADTRKQNSNMLPSASKRPSGYAMLGHATT